MPARLQAIDQGYNSPNYSNRNVRSPGYIKQEQPNYPARGFSNNDINNDKQRATAYQGEKNEEDA